MAQALAGAPGLAKILTTLTIMRGKGLWPGHWYQLWPRPWPEQVKFWLWPKY